MPAHATTGRPRGALAVLFSALSAVALSLAVPAPAASAAPHAAGADERVVKDDVALTVGEHGVAKVRETITYRFDGQDRVERRFATRQHRSVTEDRVYRVSGVRADGGLRVAGTRHDGTDTVVTLAAPQRLTGTRTFTLTYEVRGIVAPSGGLEELRWPAVGGWRVPLDEAHVTVDADAMIRNVNCFAGPLDSVIGCTQYYTNHTHTQGIYDQQTMLPGEYLTVVAGLPPGTTGGAAIFERRHTAATAFSVNLVTGGALLGLLVLLAGGFVLLYLLRGRDARVVGRKAAEGDRAHLVPDAAGADDDPPHLAAARGFEPPDGVRPGQIGTLIDEQADVIDVTATIVDLAVRGFLLIEEEDRAVTGRLDWTLRRLDRPGDELLNYERVLFDALFTDADGAPRDAVKLSELGGAFATSLARVRSAMYQDVVDQGWFARRPDTVRSRWTVAGLVLTVLGIAATTALAFTTDFALAGLAAIIAGAAMAYGGQYMPAKTAQGSTVLAHMIGFRAFLERGEIPESAAEASPQRIALFSRFLPYAVVFGVVPRWAETVKDAGERATGADNLYWYEGPAEWDLSGFAESMRTFTLTTSGAISQSRGL
ncbi:DUF2207 domain-containing protein [Actinomadura atramentaria]|uniref:DUF2207 domain-containing protein n=1 Tax=Actinomadura atramentaria TaxID=1990 RepID=UPI000369EBF7|nr:DUF2207 domain-containing protein [Actinomadura atramentaria]